MKNPQPMFLCAFVGLLATQVAFAEGSHATGRDASGLPGISRVGIPVHEGGGSFAVSGRAGYGYTEGIGSGDSAHHRGVGRLGIGVLPTDWLQLALRFDGRYDLHPNDSEGKDDGMIGDPWLVVRSGTRVNEQWVIGGELGVWFPGSGAPSVELAATTVETKLLVTMLPKSGDFALATMAGFRLDNSSKSIEDTTALRRGDLVALGASDFNAALLGLGLNYRMNATEILGEVSADLLLGANELTQSPLRVGTGVRHHLSDALQFEAMVTASLSARPNVDLNSQSIPMEPRLLTTIGLTYVLDSSKKAAPAKPPKGKPPPPPKPAEPSVVQAPVSGIVTDGAGVTLAQVNVTLSHSGGSFTTVTDDQGRYSFEDVPFGPITLRAETADFEPGRLKSDISGNGSTVELAPLKLKLATLHAQVQGLVRDFSGKPLQATITVTPPGKDHTSAADGRFAIDVEPGTYTVTISADGHAPQTRTVNVPEKGVIVFNADLRKQR